MAKVLKNKYNSTGERCVDACLNYGELRYVNEDGSPMKIEVPCDKYEEAICDFDDRVKEGITQTVMDPKEILRRGTITYNQAKVIASEGKIKGLDFFEIDGSIECEHILGISGSVEYALSIWNGESKLEALQKSVIRSMKVYGRDFIKEIDLTSDEDGESYEKFANSVYSIDGFIDEDLYRIKTYCIDSEIYFEDSSPKEKLLKGMNATLGLLGAALGFILVQIITSFSNYTENTTMYNSINMISMVVFGLLSMKLGKLIGSKYIKSSNNSIIDMFNDELERVTYDNLLTEKEFKLILKNITKGEISKLLMDLKGSVNKKISCNTLVNKETKFILDARRTVVLPSEYEIKQMVEKLNSTYRNKLASDYNVNNI